LRGVAAFMHSQPGEGVLILQESARGGDTHAAIGPGNKHNLSAHAELRFANCAAMACWFVPTILTVASEYACWFSASMAATHCQAAAAISPYPQRALTERRSPRQSLHVASSAASSLLTPCKPSHSRQLGSFARFSSARAFCAVVDRDCWPESRRGLVTALSSI